VLHSRQDTITGFLLAGVGNIDLRRKSNFLIVDQSARLRLVDRSCAQRVVLTAPRAPPAETTTRAIEEAFKDFINREDIAVILINQYVRRARGSPQPEHAHAGSALPQIADMVRHLVDSYTKVRAAAARAQTRADSYGAACACCVGDTKQGPAI
jgi:V-type H+-transporting ATPase subunit F